MHTVNRLQAALQVAQQLGYQIRHEWLGGSGGGACELRGQKLLFVDLALGPDDQLEHVLAAWRQDPQASRGLMPTSSSCSFVAAPESLQHPVDNPTAGNGRPGQRRLG